MGNQNTRAVLDRMRRTEPSVSNRGFRVRLTCSWRGQRS